MTKATAQADHDLDIRLTHCSKLSPDRLRHSPLGLTSVGKIYEMGIWVLMAMCYAIEYLEAYAIASAPGQRTSGRPW